MLASEPAFIVLVAAIIFLTTAGPVPLWLRVLLTFGWLLFLALGLMLLFLLRSLGFLLLRRLSFVFLLRSLGFLLFSGLACSPVLELWLLVASQA